MFDRKLVTMCAAVLAAVGASTVVTAAPDRTPPRIVSAAMQDADGNGRAESVRLTYSERVRHAADRDGKYPFTVAGYKLRSAGKASGKTIVLSLVERGVADEQARPRIGYRRTKAGSVLDRARNQAKAQVFRATRAHGNRPAPRPGDSDGDGVPDERDCAPTDPKIHPGAVDKPDLAFVDSNCDGIDGDERKAIFVSPEGDDGNPGTKAQPKREIDAAVQVSAGTGKDVLAAAGTYLPVDARSGVGIYGGYDDKTWKRAVVDTTTAVVGPETGVVAHGAANVVLQLLTVEGSSTGAPGKSAYGIRAINGSKLTLQRVKVIARNGSAGANGAGGETGADGRDGGPGRSGECDGPTAGKGGSAGTSPAGRTGGAGGDGGVWNLGGKAGQAGALGTPGGDGGASGDPGKRGQNGQPGAHGTAGERGNGGTSSTAVAGAAWRGIDGFTGQPGTPGMGGGGGGGGGGQSCILFCSKGSGNGGGGGGGAGGGGRGGLYGLSGGGSFGIYLFNSTVTISEGSSITTQDGGAGGAGGPGGLPGAPGLGGEGAKRCTGEIGAGGNGGDGGAGGVGGGGGGGAGGPSIGVMKVGTSEATLTDTAIQVGTPGPSGRQGPFGFGGTPAQPGIAAPVFPS